MGAFIGQTMADAEAIDIVISPGSNPDDHNKYRASLDHEACCSVLESTTYLSLLLYCSQGAASTLARQRTWDSSWMNNEQRDEHRAKDHARYSMVCKKWKEFEDAQWSVHFAPRHAYVWKSKMTTLLPSLITKENNINRSDNPFGDDEKVGPFPFYFYFICALILTFVGLVVGLSLVGHYEDGWDVDSSLLAIPFLVAALPCAMVVICWLSFCIYESCTYCGIRRAQRGLASERAAETAITLTHEQKKKLDRTMTNQSVNTRVKSRIEGGIRYSDSTDATDADMDGSESYCSQVKYACGQMEWCTKGFRIALMILFPTSMITLTVVLLTFTDTSAVVAFLPCSIILCMPWCVAAVMGVAHGIWTNPCSREEVEFEKCIPYLASITWCSFLIFLVTYPLALDGSIPNETSGDWAAALTPLFIWAFMITVVGPCTFYIFGCISTRQKCKRVALIPGICCMLGITGTFIVLLVGLCMKPSGEWDLMPYAAFAGTIVGLFACAFAAMAGSTLCYEAM